MKAVSVYWERKVRVGFTVGQGSHCSKHRGITNIAIITQADHIHIKSPAQLGRRGRGYVPTVQEQLQMN